MDRNSSPISARGRDGGPGNGTILYFPLRERPAGPREAGGGAPRPERYVAGRHHEPSLAVYRPDGSLKSAWWLDIDGLVHRPDGPAYVRHDPDGSRVEHWYLRHRLHRTSGPAIVEWARDGSVRRAQWWVAGREVTEIAEEFLDDTEVAWPLDATGETSFLRRCVCALRDNLRDDAVGPKPIVTGVCLTSLFWLPVILTVVLLWA